MWTKARSYSIFWTSAIDIDVGQQQQGCDLSSENPQQYVMQV